MKRVSITYKNNAVTSNQQGSLGRSPKAVICRTGQLAVTKTILTASRRQTYCKACLVQPSLHDFSKYLWEVV